MARPGEIADISSKGQYDFFKLIQYAGIDPDTGIPKHPKRNKDKSIKVSPDGTVSSRAKFDRGIGQPKALRAPATKEHGVKRRTSQGVERLGPVIEPGGGAPNQTPTDDQANKALEKFHALDLSREDLPDKARTKGAARNKLRSDEIKGGKKISGPVKPDGTAEKVKQDTGKSHRWRYRHDYRHPSAPVVATPPEIYAKERAEVARAKAATMQHTKVATGRRKRGKRKKPKGRVGGILDLQSITYRSKSINEDFRKSLDEILGV